VTLSVLFNACCAGCECVAVSDGDEAVAAIRAAGQLAETVAPPATVTDSSVAVSSQCTDYPSPTAIRPFDAVLMDIIMKRIDGSTACRILRDCGCTLPVIATTANDISGSYKEFGFSGFLQKPFSVSDLVAHLLPMVRPGRHADASAGKAPVVDHSSSALSHDDILS
jgi:CheY-like chemotaxis protein